MRLSSGQQVGNYTLHNRLGAGGMAEVWSATHQILRVQVALKVLFSGNPILQDRLLREGRAQAAMDHPHILPVRDVVDVGGALGLVLPLVQGPSLDKLLKTYRPTLDEAVAVFRAIVEGVAHAHQRKLIHRDLKPGNVLLEERRGRIVPRVADFGLVKGEEGEDATRAGAVMGTLQYAAPEQLLDASQVDHLADLFSLGVILVELLMGRRPFQGTSLGSLLKAYAAGPDLAGLPEAFVPLCREMLAHSPTQRLSDCGEVLDRLDAVHPVSVGALGVAGGLAKAMRALTEAAPSPSPTVAPEPSGRVSPGVLSEASGTFTDSLFDSVAPGEDVFEEAGPPKHNLPAELDSYVGRDAELSQLRAVLGARRLVTVLGTGGMGKTRFTLQYARTHLHDYPGGVFFCDLSEAQSVEGIVFVVAQAMDVPLGKGDPLQQLGHAIAGHGPCLLIFDNFEQVVAHAAKTVEAWLKRASRARFVVTSRIVLEVSGEEIFRLAPLTRDHAVDLFVQRAQSKKRGFRLTEDNSEAVTALVRQLDHLPLAIELATARIKVMKPAKMLSRMGQRFKLLATGKRNTAQRQATLRATIDWSYALLDDWEKAAFAQCAIFEGGFTLEAAEAIIDLEDFDDALEGQPLWPMDAVQSLVDKSLLRPLGENRMGEMRFGMLMSLHDYAREVLRGLDPEAVDELHQRYVSHYETFGAPDALTALDRAKGTARWWALHAELENLLVAHRFAVHHSEVEAAVRIANAVYAIAQRQQPALAIAPLHAALALDRDGRFTVGLHTRLGRLYNDMGQTTEAVAHYTTALTVGREAGDRYGVGTVLVNLANLHRMQGQKTKPKAYYEEALAIYREAGDRGDEGKVLTNLGIMSYSLGRYAEALRHYTGALAIHRTVGNRRSEGRVMTNLGHLYSNMGQLKDARAHYQRALAIHREVGNRRGEGNLLSGLGVLYATHGQMDKARAHYQRALTTHREIGNRRS
ncbi:MAG: tetratricopeptide repeat protein, partial [Myxococcota bacterium]